MNINNAGKHIIKFFEGLRLKAYKDCAGVWTVGYGETQGVRPSSTTTIEDAEKTLSERITKLENFIQLYVRAPLTQNQFSALICLTYNIGAGEFERSTLLKYLNKGDKDKAAEEFCRFVHSNGKIEPGLVKRREAEKQLFLTKEESC